MGRVQDKVVWITGASSGIGLEMARQLSARGSKLILSARRLDVLEKIKSELKNPVDVLILPLDLTKPEGFEDAISQAFSRFGKIDLLFNNAGISQRSYVIDTDISVDRQIMEVNYFGTIALTKAILPRMLAQGGGHFAVVTSLTGKFGFGVRSAYAASKHALHGFFESLYIELQDKGIRVTLICPGPVKTPISINALDGSGKATGIMDEMQEKGMPVDKAVKAIIQGIENDKREVIIGNFKSHLAVKLKAFLPGVFLRMAIRQNPRGAVK